MATYNLWGVSENGVYFVKESFYFKKKENNKLLIIVTSIKFN